MSTAEQRDDVTQGKVTGQVAFISPSPRLHVDASLQGMLAFVRFVLRRNDVSTFHEMTPS
jgi:hypothetical protein